MDSPPCVAGRRFLPCMASGAAAPELSRRARLSAPARRGRRLTPKEQARRSVAIWVFLHACAADTRIPAQALSRAPPHITPLTTPLFPPPDPRPPLCGAKPVWVCMHAAIQRTSASARSATPPTGRARSPPPVQRAPAGRPQTAPPLSASSDLLPISARPPMRDSSSSDLAEGEGPPGAEGQPSHEKPYEKPQDLSKLLVSFEERSPDPHTVPSHAMHLPLPHLPHRRSSGPHTAHSHAVHLPLGALLIHC